MRRLPERKSTFKPGIIVAVATMVSLGLAFLLFVFGLREFEAQERRQVNGGTFHREVAEDAHTIYIRVGRDARWLSRSPDEADRQPFSVELLRVMAEAADDSDDVAAIILVDPVATADLLVQTVETLRSEGIGRLTVVNTALMPEN